ncbi:pulmonary surfactant-associated protein D-like [Hoplias malabaricus]|uniref:pulmonary surfactant-associated protein D-like n=1 Tax=Hoplias malabaricus TaxID=27720 RepID=UPI0034635B48
MASFKHCIWLLLLMEIVQIHCAVAQTQQPKPLTCPLYAGVPGTPGHNGHNGRDGKDGPVGPKGQKGETGSSVVGPPGKKGPSGDVGARGPSGEKGQKGEQGTGAKGPPGATGPTGVKGQKGDPGPTGPSVTGAPGNKGSKGDVGARGPSGEKGQKGEQGTGARGPPGVTGPLGSKGQKGDPGATANVQEATVIKTLLSDVQKLQASVSMLETVMSFRIFRKVGQKYLVSNGLVNTFDIGQSHCSGFKGALAIPRNEQENQAVFYMLRFFSETQTVWLGAKKVQPTGSQLVDTKGQKVTYNKWHPGQPNSSGEDCVCMGPSDQWHDYHCKSQNLIICEF